MRDLVRSSSVLALRQALLGALSVVRTKVVAVILGPAGVGLVAQASQLTLLTSRLANLGLGNGVAKYVAQYAAADARKDLDALLGSVRWAVLAASAVVITILVCGRQGVATWIFGAPRYAVDLVLVAVATPFLAQVDTAVFALRGTRHFGTLALASLAVTGTSVAVTVALVMSFGIQGAFWAFPVAAVVGSLIMRAALARAVLRPFDVRARPRVPNRAFVSALSLYALAVLASGLSDAMGELIVRSSLVHRLGADANGIYHASWSVANQFGALFGSTLVTWGLPTMASLGGDPARVNDVRNDLLRAYLLAGVPLAVVALLTASLWLPLLFSRRFLPAAPLLTWQLAAQIVLGVRAMLNTSLWAHERLRMFILLTLSQTAIYLTLYFLLVGTFGLTAVPVAFLGSQLAVLVPTAAYVRRVESMRLDRPTKRVALTSTVVVGVWILALTGLGPGAARSGGGVRRR